MLLFIYLFIHYLEGHKFISPGYFVLTFIKQSLYLLTYLLTYLLSLWILKRLNETHYVPLFTSDHMCANSPFKRFISMHNNSPSYLLKPYGSFILYCFCPSHLQCSFVFKTLLGKYESCKSCVLYFEINQL